MKKKSENQKCGESLAAKPVGRSPRDRRSAEGRVSSRAVSETRRVVLVGTYKGDQLSRWRGWYNYPISNEDKITEADAAKEKMVREALGRAEAIRTTQQATADGIRMIKEAGADQSVLALKSLEVWPSVANGRATKIIIPSEIQNMAGLVESLKEIAVDSNIDAGEGTDLPKADA